MRDDVKIAFCLQLLWWMLGCPFWISCTAQKEKAPEPQAPVIHFVDIAEQAGLHLENVCGNREKKYIVEAKGGGMASFDYDNDGDLDLYVINGSKLEGFAAGQEPRNALYRNEGDGTFRDVAEQAGVADTSWGMGCVAADYDNDGDADLYVANFGRNRLYRNEGDGTFRDVAEQAGVADQRMSTGCAFGDYDRDGFLDLYVANYIHFDMNFRPVSVDAGMWRGIKVFYGPRGLKGAADVLFHNQGDGTFRDVTEEAGVVDGDRRYGFAVLFHDFDDDGDADIFVANDSGRNMLYQNEGNGRFSDVAVERGVAFLGNGEAQACMGAAFGDYDNDGDFDLYVTNFAEDYNTLYQNDGKGFFADVTSLARMLYPTWKQVGWGAGFADLDNDGREDLFVANGHVYHQIDQFDQGSSYPQRNIVFWNRGDGTFADVSAIAGPGLEVEKVSRGASLGDFDNDGDIDIAVLNLNDTPTLLRNDTPGDNHWLSIRTRGSQSNRDGIGARVRVAVGAQVQVREIHAGSNFISQDDIRAHFGLGQAERVDRLEVEWPSGVVDTMEDIAADRFVVVREGEGVVGDAR